MKLKVAENEKTIEGELVYTKYDYSFDFYPNKSADCALLIGYINITFDSVTRLGRQIWGCEPYTVWKNKKLTPPHPREAGIMVGNDIDSCDVLRIWEADEFTTYFDESNGWVCVGEDLITDTDDVIEFARNTVIVLRNGEIAALWLKPVFK